ncbi:MAG TPA: entericidin A/B family lipoprotein [Candidatus Limnocylindria bacterium]|jgi:predicted small secreted protein|nr:entericidin A/B family lipoprotein [Candidatus Limnocylindria bacterium]
MKAKQFLILFLLGLWAATNTACKHTANGFGQDVEKAGEKIQEKTQ